MYIINHWRRGDYF